MNKKSLLHWVWMALLILPAVTTMSSSNDWDVDQYYLFFMSCWTVAVWRLLSPGRFFFFATLPVVLMGLACMTADFHRNADLLELTLQWRTFSCLEIAATLRPYRWFAFLSVIGIFGFSWLCFSMADKARPSRNNLLIVVFGTAAFAAIAPGAVWVRSWPLQAGLVIASAATNSRALAPHLFPSSSTMNPRDPLATWNATRNAGAQVATHVFIIGESVRSDYLLECGGPSRVRSFRHGTLVACDMTSGADATHTSVPLLVSREMPGHAERVSSDATFAHAFQEVGFETHWFGVQGQSIAWADAQYQSYPSGASDADDLLPLLKTALHRPHPLKMIVLHAYNAHEPYCARFKVENAPYPIDCNSLNDEPKEQSSMRFRTAYANAVDASVGFVNEVIAALEDVPGQVFLTFTPDHGENFADDGRKIFGHALRHPTRWDVQVPAVFWANRAWRDAHPAQWKFLANQVAAPLMHADVVPTFLAAADIGYSDTRALPVNLLATRAGSRHRLIQRSLGAQTDWETLVKEAR